MGLKLMENMVNFSPDSDLLSDPVLLCIFSFYCQKCPKYLICCRLVMVLILRKTSCIEIYWRRLLGLGSDYWQSSACSYSSNTFTFQANILIWDTWTRYFILLVLHVPLVSAWYWGVFYLFHKIKNIFWHSFIQQKFKSILFLNTSPLDLLIFERNYKKDANTSWGQNMIFSFKV